MCSCCSSGKEEGVRSTGAGLGGEAGAGAVGVGLEGSPWLVPLPHRLHASHQLGLFVFNSKGSMAWVRSCFKCKVLNTSVIGVFCFYSKV